MTAVNPQSPRQALVVSWIAQMVGTVVVAAAVLAFVRAAGTPFPGTDPDWKRLATTGIIAGIAPALLYLRTFKPLLDADEAAVRATGAPDPAIRPRLARALSVGGALCEIPMALGAVQLFLGGETRWFVGATLVTIALRLSFRPFTRA